jgi:hypothetical protein
MKSIQLNEAMMGRLAAPEKMPVADHSLPAAQSFRSSWPREMGPQKSGTETLPAKSAKSSEVVTTGALNPTASVAATVPKTEGMAEAHAGGGTPSDGDVAVEAHEDVQLPLHAVSGPSGQVVIVAPVPAQNLSASAARPMNPTNTVAARPATTVPHGVSTASVVKDSDEISEKPATAKADEAAPAAEISVAPMMVATPEMTVPPTSVSTPVTTPLPMPSELATGTATPVTIVDGAKKLKHEHAPVATTAAMNTKVEHKPDVKTEISSITQGSEISTPAMAPIIAVGLNPIAKVEGGSVKEQPASLSKVPGTVKAGPPVAVAALQVTMQPAVLTSEQLAPVPTKEPVRHTVEVESKATVHESVALKTEYVSNTAVHPGDLLAPASGLRSGAADALTAFPSPHPAVNSPSTLKSSAQLDITNGAPASVTSPAPQTIVATPSRLDVGILNGTHGWLQVRAELGAGGAVNTSVTAIDAAHESLQSAVPEIASYLNVEAVKVNSIEVHRFAESVGTPSGMGDQSQTQGGGQGDGPQRQQQDAMPMLPNGSSEKMSMEVGDVASRPTGGLLDDGGSETSLSSLASSLAWRGVGVGGSGAWLSVRA